MGASGWLVMTPKQGTIEDGLRHIKREVFAAGEFQDTFGIVANPDAAIASLDNFDLPSDLPLADQADYLAFIREEQSLKRSAILRYKTAQNIDARIEALREAVGFDGTHSVIDIASANDLFQAATLDLIAHFGTDLPDIATVRAFGYELENLVQARFTGIWFEAQDENQAIFFVIVGVSGD